MDTDEKKMIEAIKNKNANAFNYAQASYDYKSKHFIKEASDIVYSVDDENERNKLQDLVESVRTSSNSVNAMGSKCALQKFDDDLSNANLMNQIKYSTACAKYINGELNCQLMSGMARICHDISNRDYDITSFGNAYMKAIFREGQLQKEDLDRLIMNIDKLNEDYQTMNETVSSKHYSFYTDNIERKIENVDRMKDVLLDALQAIIENPKESNLRKYLKNVAEVWCDQVKALRNSLVVEPGLFTTQELLNNTMGSFTKSIDKLTNESDKLNSDESKQLRKKAITSAKLFLDVAKYEMSNTKNEAYRKELLKNIEAVEKDFTLNKIHSG
jgi:Fe-S-cluster formation regulator IscX/YfhJ